MVNFGIIHFGATACIDRTETAEEPSVEKDEPVQDLLALPSEKWNIADVHFLPRRFPPPPPKTKLLPLSAQSQSALS